MAKIQINSVTNANIYEGAGNSWLGRAKEVQVPEAPFKMVDHEALGMVGMTELFAGIDKMEMSIMWNSAYADALKKVTNPNQPLQLQVRGNLRVSNSEGLTDEQPIVFYVTATPKNLPGFNFKQHENVELETKLVVTYLRLEIDSESIYEVDVLANIFKVNGVDILAKYRANIGG